MLFAISILNFCGISGPVAFGDDDLQVLLIGNSLTYWNDMPATLVAMFEAAGIEAHVASVAHPNFGLEDHWNRGEALDSIRRGGWSVVALQQGPSATEGRPSLLEYTENFSDSIEAIGARTALYMVWPSASRDFEFDAVARSYRDAAELVNGMLFPVGQAWSLVWRDSPTISLYGPDDFHPSPFASYLAAAIIFGRVSGEDPVGLPSTLERRRGGRLELPTTVARLLQEAAREANQRFGM